MKRLINCFILSTLILIIVTASGCGKNQKELILGKWTRTSISQVYADLFYPTSIAFYEDGSASVGGKELPTTIAGKYNFINDKTIKLDIQPFSQVIIEVEVSKNILTLVFPKGEKANYERNN